LEALIIFDFTEIYCRLEGSSLKALSICMVIVCWLGLTSARADEKASNNVLDKSITFNGATQAYQADCQLGRVKEGVPDIGVDLKDLGLDEKTVSPIKGGVVNFRKRWTLRLDYFGYHDDGKKTADNEFNFDDITFHVGSRLDSSLDIDLYVANLSYNFIHTKRARLGVGVGVHAADINLKVSGKVYLDSVERNLGTGNEDLLAPLPNLYVMGAYSFIDRSIVRVGAGGMSLNSGDWDGSLYFVNTFVEYWPFRYAGLGTGYRYLTADVEYEPGHKKETYDVDLPGPVIYITASF